jgi:hypothetical protein
MHAPARPQTVALLFAETSQGPYPSISQFGPRWVRICFEEVPERGINSIIHAHSYASRVCTLFVIISEIRVFLPLA